MAIAEHDLNVDESEVKHSISKIVMVCTNDLAFSKYYDTILSLRQFNLSYDLTCIFLQEFKDDWLQKLGNWSCGCGGS